MENKTSNNPSGDKAVLRYVVPFKFSEKFSNAVQKADNSNMWERKTAGSEEAESDLYVYVRNEFCFDAAADGSSDISEKKTGLSWTLADSEKLSRSKKGVLRYYTEPGNKEYREIWLSDGGLLLFRNGLGFLWYELDCLQKTESITVDQLMDFQFTVKELNRNEVSSLWFVPKKETKKEETKTGCLIEEKIVHGKETPILIYGDPFSLGKWIDERLDFLTITYFAERKSAYGNMVRKSLEKMTGQKEAEKTGSLNADISGEADPKKNRVLPDKPILFTYCLIEQETGDSPADRQALAYHLTNGYKESYKYSKELSKDMVYPFENAIWYATKEGASYLAWPNNDNREAFENTIRNKVCTDYFTLYLKALYQSYSLLIFAERIQSEVSYAPQKGTEISELYEDINMFLARSMATSISHIDHQNEFYVYLKKKLKIHEDVKSVTSGMEALDRLQKEKEQDEQKKKDDILQIFLGLIAGFSIFSVVQEYWHIAKTVSSEQSLKTLLGHVSTVGWLGIAGLVIILIIWLFAMIKLIKNLIEKKRGEQA